MFFVQNQSNNVVYHNGVNEFMVRNNENKGDYYVNSGLSKLTNEL